MKEFSSKCSQQAMAFFKEELPVGNIWRKKKYNGSTHMFMGLHFDNV